MTYKQANTYTIQCMGQGISLKSKMKIMDQIMSYSFYCTHNQLRVPQYKVNVQSTWDIYLWFFPSFLSLSLYLLLWFVPPQPLKFSPFNLTEISNMIMLNTNFFAWTDKLGRKIQLIKKVFYIELYCVKSYCLLKVKPAVLDRRPKFYGRSRRFQTQGYGGRSFRPLLRPQEKKFFPRWRLK